MLLDETCWFLAADFDKETWRKDITATLKTCSEYGIPAYIERSRSGNGRHVWIFFREAVLASDARKLGTALLTKTMEHHPIIFMQCGPTRHKVDARNEATKRDFAHSYFTRATNFHLPLDLGMPPIQTIYQQLAQDEARNELIFNDVLHALDADRSPVLLTERREHVAYFAERLSGFAKNIVVLQGGMGVKQRKAAYDTLSEIPNDQERLLIATGRYLGEGFDDARFDTLFLTMPVSWMAHWLSMQDGFIVISAASKKSWLSIMPT